MTTARPTVCVIGGGISGLVVTHSLLGHEPAPRVVVYEASDRLGGAIRTDVVDGVTVEAGADSFLTRAPDAVELCASLGLEPALIAPAVFGANVLRRGAARPLVEMAPDFVFGMPATTRGTLRASHLTKAARLRAALEPWLPGPRTTGDVAVGELVRRRYGKQLLAQSVDPLLAGTRAGRADEMSFEAALPQVWALVRGRRSLTHALARARKSNAIPPGPPPFKSVEGGLERVVAALRERCERAEILTGVRVESVEPGARRMTIRTRDGSTECDAVVAATPAFEAARLLERVNPRASELLQSIEFASVATITCVYPPAAHRALPGSGLLVPSSAGSAMSACTWYSIKWPHAAPPDGGLVIRSFVGRAGEDAALRLPDDELIALVARETQDALGLKAKPRATRLTRWPKSLPQYRVGHVGLVERIESALEDTPGIWVTGASYRGSGIPDCIKHARATAARVAGWLGP